MDLLLTDMLSFLGLAGTVIAIPSAVIAAFAFAVVGAPTGGCIAIAGWIGGLMLSLSGCFVGNWILPGVSVVALPLALVLARGIGLLRVPLRSASRVHVIGIPPRDERGEGHA